MAHAVLLMFILVQLTRFGLLILNLKHLRTHGNSVPHEFKGVVDPNRLSLISKYTIETSRMEIIESIPGALITVFFFFGGLLSWYDQWIASLNRSYVVNGIVFTFILLSAQTVLSLPFSYYNKFVIEKRFGFNTMTFKLWVVDEIKSFLLSAVLMALVAAVVLGIWRADPLLWWLWVWAFLLFFGIFMMYISPVLIEPLFYKFEPIRLSGLEEKIVSLMEKADLRVSRVFQMDASKRSKHSNAYFTGIGRVKRIVVFDTLLEQLTQDEIIAVLAHEAGHWKKRHVMKSIVLSEALAFVGLFLASRLVAWEGLPAMMGVTEPSFFARIAIVVFLGNLVMFPLVPFFSYISRKNEREADAFACKLTGHPEDMASSLIKLSHENLANLHPHPLYALIYYSHPPVVERIRSLRSRKQDRIAH